MVHPSERVCEWDCPPRTSSAELGSTKSGQKSHCAKFSWREVIEWRKLASRTCALGAIDIADFNRRQPFSVCASLEVESVSYSRRREGVPRSAAPRMGRANGQLVVGAGQ